MSYFGIPIRNGLPIGLGSVAPLASGGGSPFSPLSLFSGGTPGAWYDPSDYTTLFQDSAGTTPVTAVEQPVGLMLDKSQGLVLGSEIANTSLSSWSPFGATVSVNSNVATVNATATEPILLSPAITTVVGVTYQFVATLTKGTVTTNNAYLAATNNSNASGAFAVTPETGNGGGTITLYFRATATTTYVYARWGQAGVGTTFTVSNITVKELAGNHAFQATSASRPVLSARYNLLTKTEQFDDAVWTKTGGATVQSNVAIAPDGTTTADELTLGASGAVRQIVSVVASSTYVWVKAAASGSATHIRISTNNALAWGTGYGTKVALTSEWQRISAAGAVTGNTSTSLSIGVLIPTDGSNDPDCYGKVLIWGADLKPSNQSTLPYQRVNTSTDYATTGFLPYLKFDVDDSLSTNSISFTSTDKMSVFAGVRKLSDAARGTLAELGPDALTNNGSFLLGAPYNTGSNEFKFYCGGTTRTGVDYLSPGTPTTRVITGLNNIATPVVTIRADGVQAATSSSSQGTGNYGNYPLYIGRRNNASLPFNGQLYSMIIVGKAVTAGELTNTEKFVATKTGVTL